ncbi:uncharacterized protein LOC111099861 isoform X2 [Crassostrea virginica]
MPLMFSALQLLISPQHHLMKLHISPIPIGSQPVYNDPNEPGTSEPVTSYIYTPKSHPSLTMSQHNSKKLSESPPCLQEKKPLQKDPSDPAKYADIFVNKKRERECLLVTKQSKTPGIQLLNSTLSLVFTDKELGESSGMGLKRHNGNPGKPVLDSLKIEAIKRMSITIASIIIGNVSHLLLSTIRFQIRYVMSDRR